MTDVVTVLGIAVTIACRPLNGAPPTRTRRLETWLWTGPVGHLIAGLLDWFQAVAVWLAHMVRRRVARGRRGR